MTEVYENKEQLDVFYSERIENMSLRIAYLKRKNRIYVVSELITFCTAATAFALYLMKDSQPWLVCASAVLLIAYVCIRRADIGNGERTERLKRRRAVYARELKYLEGDYSCFDDGKRYVDPQHAFTFDMDIYGRESLFNRIDRTVTTGGSDALASALGRLPENRKQVDMRHEAVRELSERETWRTEFLSAATDDDSDCPRRAAKTDTEKILAAIDNVRRLQPFPAAAGKTALVTACAAIAGFLLSIAGAVSGMLPGGIAVTWGTVQLFVVLTITSRPLREISRAAERMQDRLQVYHTLAELIRGAEFESRELRSLTDELFAQGTGPTEAFGQLSEILKGIDRRGNVLGLTLFNMFGLSDFFLVRKFIRWQRTYMDNMSRWTDIISRFDALVSMATFAFNEPEGSAAVVEDSEEIVYDGRGLYHPFLGRSAVSNDFTLSDGHYYIITGANMAGKSTFLRSIGINYVLAMNGMPVFAESLRLSVFNLFTSMRTTDDLTRGISYFNAELLRLRLLTESCQRGRRTLIILDEILKGTNSLDKLNGSRLFLERMSLLPVTGIIATHDLELSKMADSEPARFHNYCFEIELTADIVYTYRITPGVARNQNATYLLKRILDGKDIQPESTVAIRPVTAGEKA